MRHQMIEVPAHECSDECAYVLGIHRRLRITRRREQHLCPLELRFVALHADDLAIEAQFVAEVVEEQRLVIARRLGDGIHPRPIEAIAGENLFRRAEDSLTRYRRLRSRRLARAMRRSRAESRSRRCCSLTLPCAVMDCLPAINHLVKLTG